MVINGEQAITMPQEGSRVQFENYHKQIPLPFVIYADFEAITDKVSGCQLNNAKSYTNKYQKHTSCSYGYKVVCCYDDKYSKPSRHSRLPRNVISVSVSIRKQISRLGIIVTSPASIEDQHIRTVI